MKKYLIPLLFLPSLLFGQCIPEPECGIANTISAAPKATSHWVRQTFTTEESGYLQYIKMYVAVSGNVPYTMSFRILSSNEEVLFNDTLLLPPTENNFVYCDTANWSGIYPENLFINGGQLYSFVVEKIEVDSIPWIVYSVNNSIFSQGSCTNDLNEVEGLPDPSDPGTYDQMLSEDDCAFVIGMQCPCLGDYNFDGQRSVADLVIFMGAFGEINSQVNLVGENLVSVEDLIFFIGLYGQPCP